MIRALLCQITAIHLRIHIMPQRQLKPARRVRGNIIRIVEHMEIIVRIEHPVDILLPVTAIMIVIQCLVNIM